MTEPKIASIRLRFWTALCYCFGNGWTGTQILAHRYWHTDTGTQILAHKYWHTNGGFQQAPCRWVDPIVAECQGVRNRPVCKPSLPPKSRGGKADPSRRLALHNRDESGSGNLPRI